MSYTYATFQEALTAFTGIALTGANANSAFVAALPTIIDQAEQRIYQDLQLLATVVRDTTTATTPGTRNFTLPTPAGASRFVVLQSLNILNGDQRYPVVKCSRELLDMLWPSDTGNGSIPNRWAPLTDVVVLLGPAPTTAYDVECIGTIRPAALSSSNTSTFLSSQLPGLFFAAAMLTATGYMKNFGSQSDDPKMSASWQTQYDQMLPLAKGEETARKFASFYGSAG
jgi:hypothetical protein